MAKLFRFTVPESDTEVIKWLDEQDKVSTSLRLLIKQYVATHGQGDIINTIVLADGRRRAPVRDTSDKVDNIPAAPAVAQTTPVAPVAQAAPAAPTTPASGTTIDPYLASMMSQ